MTDEQPKPQEPPPPPSRITATQTAAVSATTMGGGSIISWIFECIHAHAIVQPDQTAVIVMAAALAPLAHATGQAYLTWLDHRTALLTAKAAANGSH